MWEKQKREENTNTTFLVTEEGEAVWRTKAAWEAPLGEIIVNKKISFLDLILARYNLAKIFIVADIVWSESYSSNIGVLLSHMLLHHPSSFFSVISWEFF